MRILMLRFAAIVIGLSLLCLPSTILGEELCFPKTEEQFVSALGAKSPNQTQIKTRSIRTRGLSVASTTTVPPKAGALINFDRDSSAIDPRSYDLLDNFGRALNGGLSDAVIVVAGHTDSDGTDQYNIRLSEKRAQAVADYLIYRHRIARARLIVRGYGETAPIADNYTANGKSLNRRVEFIREP